VSGSKSRGTCRGGPLWPPLGRQVSYRKNQVLSRLPGLPPSATRRPPQVDRTVAAQSVSGRSSKTFLERNYSVRVISIGGVGGRLH
jgi:hypothetical protein